MTSLRPQRYKDGLPIIFLHDSPAYPVNKVGKSWRMIVDYYQFNQVLTPFSHLSTCDIEQFNHFGT